MEILKTVSGDSVTLTIAGKLSAATADECGAAEMGRHAKSSGRARQAYLGGTKPYGFLYSAAQTS
jgi:hypothetical protein